MQLLGIIGIFVFGGGALYFSFKQMKPGFGPFNLRVVGIIVVATFAAVLGVSDPEKFNQAMTILGAIAGYLFGFSKKAEE